MAYGLNDVVQQRRMIAESTGDDAHKRRQTAHLNAMLALCETVECRRVNLLSYFGQTASPCGNCDTCLNPPSSWDGTLAAQKLLSTVVRLDRERGQHFGAGQLIDILRGTETDKVRQWRHHTLSTWGIGADLTQAQWRSVVRQLLARGDLSTDTHAAFSVTESGWEVMRGHREVSLREDVVRRAGAVGGSAKSRTKLAAPVELASEHADLFEALRQWRTGQARVKSVPPYVVFHDSTLRTIASERPASLEQLATISGVGAAKLEAYGEAVLAVIRDQASELGDQTSATMGR
jgi:ATP-dependent DNA helicase RecQ